MTTPTPSTSQLGAVIGDYPGSVRRFGFIVIGALSLYVGVVGIIGNIEFDTAYRVLFTLIALICGWEFFANYGIHAQVFEHGFTFSRGGATTSVRWEDITGVRQQVRRGYIIGVIPEPWVTRTYTITLRGGKPVTLSSSHLSNVEHLGGSIQKMRAKAKAATTVQDTSQDASA